MRDWDAYAEFVADVVGDHSGKIALTAQDLDAIDQFLDSLGVGQQSKRSFGEVLKLSYGLDGKKRSQKEIAQHYGVSQSAIGVSIAQAFRRLSSPSRRQQWATVFGKFRPSADDENREALIESLEKRLKDAIGILQRLKVQPGPSVTAAKDIETTSSPATEQAPLNEKLFRSVDELELSIRSANALKHLGIRLIGDLLTYTEVELLMTKNFGRRSLAEIKEVLAEMGLAFGMAIPAEYPPK